MKILCYKIEIKKKKAKAPPRKQKTAAGTNFLPKKYRKAEYVQRRVRFVNVQVPCPHSIIYVKFCTCRLCMKMLSFLFVRACAMPRILFLSCGIPFPV